MKNILELIKTKNAKKIFYGIGGMAVGLILDFFQNQRMDLEIQEQVQKALEDRESANLEEDLERSDV